MRPLPPPRPRRHISAITLVLFFAYLTPTQATSQSSPSPSASLSSPEPAASTGDNPSSTYAHVAFFKHEALGTDPNALSVLLDGRPASDVLLHNATVLSFRVPSVLLSDRSRFRATFVDIILDRRQLVRLPLHTLESAISHVDLSDLRRDILSRQSATSPPAASLLADAEDLLRRDTPAAIGRAIPLLRDAAHAGNPRAMTTLASLQIFAPLPATRNLTSAANLLQNASSSVGEPTAQSLLAFLYASGIAAPAVPKDMAAALLLWTVAARAGSIEAKMALAFRYYYGTDLPEDCEYAAAYYRSVADHVYEATRAADHGPHRNRALKRRNRAVSTHKKAEKASTNSAGYSSSDKITVEEEVEEHEEFAEDDIAEISADDVGDADIDTDESDGLTQKIDQLGELICAPTPPAIHLAERKHLSDSGSSGSLGEANEIVQYSQHLAERGDAAAQMMMGRLYFHGAAELPRDVDRARKLFAQAARGGKYEAHAALGLVDLQRGDFQSAAKHLGSAAAKKDRSGLTGLGFMKLFGIGMPRDAQRAAVLFQTAARKDHAEAVYNLGLLHGLGVGVPQSLGDMRKYLEHSARRGNLRAAYRLGIMLLEQTSSRNCQQGTVYLKEVAQNGKWDKVLGLALRAHERGKYADALLRYLRAGHAGIEEAQFNAAFMYEHGSVANGILGSRTGGRKHMEAAMEMYQMSAAQGNAEAMVRMGDLAFGTGVDYERAMHAYERAVKFRSAEAMFNLGWMHARGVGMTADRHMAKRYFDMAIETDVKAKIPAGIALFWLRHGDEFAEVEEKLAQVWVKLREALPAPVREWVGEALQSKDGVMNSDVLLVSALLGLLVLVINARQRRLLSRRQTPGDGDELFREEAPGAEVVEPAEEQPRVTAR